MKTLNLYINEKLKIDKNTTDFNKHTLFPKTAEELKEMIKAEIEKNGNECSLNHIDVSKITNMSTLFSFFEFNGDISSWDVSNVTSMYRMFHKSSFNGDISLWNVSNVTNMECMFSQSEFTGENGDISNWNVSNVNSDWLNILSIFVTFETFHRDISPVKLDL